MKTHIDTLSLIISDDDEMAWLDDLQDVFCDVGALDFLPRKFGKNHYDNGAHLTHNGALLAEVNWGGHTQGNTVQVNLKGIGCMLVPAWDPVITRLLEFTRCRISRVDIALDVYDGSLDVAQAYAKRDDPSLWKKDGTKGGRPPKFFPQGDMHEATPYGRTLYIGNRENAVFTRIYEKGLEMHPGAARHDLVQAPNGIICRAGDWTRFEVEFKSRDGYEITLEMLRDTDALFASAYPFAAALVGCMNPTPRTRIEQHAAKTVAGSVKFIRHQCGSMFNSLSQLGYTPEQLIAMVTASYPNEELLRNGARMADRQLVDKLVERETEKI